MLVGLDFDNTLARYDNAFAFEAKRQSLVPNEWLGTKQDLKNRLHAMENGDMLWQKIQGQVYGPSIHKAKLFPGVARFLLRCKLQDHTVFIVSHKTKYGHFDPTKTLLRQAALDWMQGKGFFDENEFAIHRENVFLQLHDEKRLEK